MPACYFMLRYEAEKEEILTLRQTIRLKMHESVCVVMDRVTRGRLSLKTSRA